MKTHIGRVLAGGVVAAALYMPVFAEAQGPAMRPSPIAQAEEMASPAPPAAPQGAPAPKPAAAPKPAKAPASPGAPASPEAPQAPDPAPAPGRDPAPGRERAELDTVNVRFDITVSYQAGTAAAVKRSASIVVSNGSGMTMRRGLLRSGNNIPVPTTTFTPVAQGRGDDGKEPPPAKPVTSYSYRSVGFNVDIEQAAVLPGNRVRAIINIESSGVDDKAPNATGAPSFPTFSQALPLYLDSGKPVVVAQSTEVVDNVERRQTVEVKATILR
jgi:hypothetical protein